MNRLPFKLKTIAIDIDVDRKLVWPSHMTSICGKGLFTKKGLMAASQRSPSDPSQNMAAGIEYAREFLVLANDKPCSLQTNHFCILISNLLLKTEYPHISHQPELI